MINRPLPSIGASPRFPIRIDKQMECQFITSLRAPEGDRTSVEPGRYFLAAGAKFYSGFSRLAAGEGSAGGKDRICQVSAKAKRRAPGASMTSARCNKLDREGLYASSATGIIHVVMTLIKKTNGVIT